MRSTIESKAQGLGETRAGSTVRVVRLEGEESLCRRLREMGFCEEAEVKVVSAGGQVVCQVCGSRVGLSRGLAGSILVRGLKGG